MPNIPDLPPHLLATPFTVATARAAGVPPEHLRTRLLQRPFYGVRSTGLDLTNLRDHCLAYSARMHPAGVISHTTAARLWGMPLPLAIPDELHVTVPVPHRAPSGLEVVGHQQRLSPRERVHLDGLAVASPAATWAQLGELLSVEDLLAVGEHMITGNPYEKRLALAEMADLLESIAVRPRGPGHRIRVAAVSEMRSGPLSRPESFVRVLLVRCGIPNPLINEDVCSVRGEFIAMPDLQWPEFRVALEYQGDHHREKKRFRADIARLERLIDAGWIVVQVSASELYGNPAIIVDRVARRLASRGWVGRINLRRLTAFTP